MWRLPPWHRHRQPTDRSWHTTWKPSFLTVGCRISRDTQITGRLPARQTFLGRSVGRGTSTQVIGSRLPRFPSPPRISRSLPGSGGRRILPHRYTVESREAVIRGSYGYGTTEGSRSPSTRRS